MPSFIQIGSGIKNLKLVGGEVTDKHAAWSRLKISPFVTLCHSG
jgi:hypothetical protein